MCPRFINGERICLFEPHRYIRSNDDVDQCETLLIDYFTVIQNFYVELLSKSTKYPEIDQ